MQTFETQITVSNQHLDMLNHVNNVQYVQWVQDIAEQHWNAFYWVMLSHHIRYKGEAILNDVITLKTFVTKAEGVKSTRVVEIYNQQTNKLLTTSETEWCLMSKKTHRPTRITPEIATLFS
jgi:acyl-CoA thioester hydrolase